MDLDEMIIAVYCEVDDALKKWTQTLVRANGEARLRERGPQCTLSDSEVIAMEVVGAFLGHHEDAALLRYFQRHHLGLFPKALGLHRTTFSRQAANLWKAKEQVWQHLLRLVPHQPTLSFIDSTPLPVCRFARASFCRRFAHQDAQGLQASYGYDHVARQTFYGFRLHLKVSFPGVVTGVALTQAHISDVATAPQLLQGHEGIVLGDRNYHSPALQRELEECAPHGTLLTPPKKKTEQEDKRRSAFLSRLRYRIECVLSQWCQRLKLRHVTTRTTWHLLNRLLRALLCHTLCVFLNYKHDLKPLQFAKLLS